MRTKILEIRDRATFIPVLCIEMKRTFYYDDCSEANYLLRRLGFGAVSACIALISLNKNQVFVDPYEWNDRTYIVAHDYIARNWEELSDGDVVDVEFILGETKVKKKSERFNK